MKKRYFILISVLIIAILFRTLFIDNNFFGVDAHYHYSIVEQSLEKGRLSSNNELEACYDGVKGGHPIGYYFFHYYFAKIFGLKAAFYILPIVFGLISIIIAFFLVKKLFNKRTAYFTIFLMAISLSFISKTLPRTFRGEPIVYPLFLLGLLLGWKALHKKGVKISILAGLILGASSFFWNGYIIVLICANLSIMALFFYNYFKKIEKKQVINAVAILLAQLLTVILVAFIFMSENLKGFIFATRYLPLFVVFLIVGVIFFYLTQKFSVKKKLLMFSLAILIIFLLAFIFREDSIKLLYGMGSFRRDSVFLPPEMTSLSLSHIYVYFGFLSLSFLIGAYVFFKGFSEKKSYFLGAFIPALYAAYFAHRFIFFSAFFVLCFSAIAFDYFLSSKKGKRNIALIFIIGFIIIVLLQSINSVNYFASEKISESTVEGLKYFGENTPKRSCLISPLRCAIYYYSDRYGYLYSLGGATSERSKKYADFMLRENVLDFSIENLYVAVEDRDIAYYWTLNELAKIEGLEGSLFITKTGSYEKGEYIIEEHYDKVEGKRYMVNRYKDKLEAYRVINNKAIPITHVFDFDKEYVYNAPYGDCFYSGNYGYYLNEKMCNTMGFRMLVGKEIEGMEKFYSAPNFKIYKILPLSS